MQGIQTSLEITGDQTLFEDLSNNLRDTKPLMKQIGVFALSSALLRLPEVLSDDPDAIRTGRLQASYAVNLNGDGNQNSIFKLSESTVEVGSNLPYAHKVQVGGRIQSSRPGGALAIPLQDRLKREQLWPSELDPGRDHLSFIPIRGGASNNVIGLLIDDENVFGFGEDAALFAIAKYVDLKPRPHLFWSPEDIEEVTEGLVPTYLGLN